MAAIRRATIRDLATGWVRLEPFDAVELPAWELFGMDEAPPES